MSGVEIPRDEAADGAARGEGFRADLEGMRAVAVLLVLAFHAGLPGFDGGYVGVDVFFVLSGFLITGLLVRELAATGRISLPRFYARRARRLLPAAALTLLATLALSAILLPPLRVPDVTADVVAAAGYVSNLRFGLGATDYLASDLPPSPVLHFWSLGVEEQFYLLWPALLALVAGAAFRTGGVARGHVRVGMVLVVVFTTSLLLAVWLTGVQQPWAFFLLPTRAWELALGGVLALPVAARVVPKRLGPLVGWTGLALVVASALVLDEATPYPGTAALLPTLGTAMVIASGLGSRGAGSVLALAPVRYLGRISYSLYLWHWPLLVLPAVALGSALSPAATIALVGLAVLVASASHRWVEEPIRRGALVGTHPPRVLATAGAFTVLIAVAGAAVTVGAGGRLQGVGPAAGGGLDEVPLPSGLIAVERPPQGVRSRATGPGATLPPLAPAPVPADLAPDLASARDDVPIIYSNGCHLGPPDRRPRLCVSGVEDAATTVVLYGDSHAAQWHPALEEIAAARRWRLVSLTKSACSSIDVPVWSTLFNRPYTECDEWREAALAQIADEHPALVVLANDRNYPLDIDGHLAWSTDHEDVWSAGVARTLRQLGGVARSVVLIGETARMREDPPACLSAHLDDASICSSPFDQAVATTRLADDAGVAPANGATFIDPTSFMCFTDPCPSVIGRFLVYRDTHHLTATYARALASRLEAALPSLDILTTSR